MKVSIVTCNRGPEVLAVTGALTAEQIHDLAEAFTVNAGRSPNHARVRKAFGKWNFRSYCLDFSGPHRCRITFSVRVKPDCVFYKGGPIAIAPGHAAKLELYIEEVDAAPMAKHFQAVHFCDAGRPDGQS